MIEKIINKLKNKKIAILGFGREGKSTYRFIRKYLKEEEITIIDKVDIYSANKELFSLDERIHFICGDTYLENLDIYDVIIKSPGVSFNKIDISKFASKITSQMELLLTEAHDRVIGVTGTKGKSTTSSLIYTILKTKYKVLLAGNIGIPVFDLDLEDEEQLYVLELSSHQLEYLDVSPKIGIVLNLFQDHLDHALSVSHYHQIKLNMFSNQKKSDYMIYCSSNETLNHLVKEKNFNGIPYSVDITGKDHHAIMKMVNEKIYYKGTKVFESDLKRNILGNHNLENIMVAYLVGKIFDIEDNVILEAISNFEPLPYRMEYMGKIKGIDYYIDTLATIPEATKEAINTLENVNTLVFGGMDRGISYDGFVEFLNHTSIKHFICMPTTGHEIGKCLSQDRTYFVDTLEEAVKLVKKVTDKDTICLFSPAAASYEYFKNYQEKGDRFKELVFKDEN